MFPKIQTASKLESFLAKSFGKINTSEDSGVVTVISKWRGKYYVLSQTHAQQSVLRTSPRKCEKCALFLKNHYFWRVLGLTARRSLVENDGLRSFQGALDATPAGVADVVVLVGFAPVTQAVRRTAQE